MTECRYRMITCRYCGEPHVFHLTSRGEYGLEEQDPVDRFLGLSVHESRCGNRTVDCRMCGEQVMVRYLSDHYLMNHKAKSRLKRE